MTKHIIIVDDNPLLRKMVLDILQIKFPEVMISEACSGIEMWHLIQKHLPDLVFMDIKLARENGLKLTQEIKEKYPEIVIAIFTNHDLCEYRDQAQICGAEYFLSKLESKAEDLILIASKIIGKPI